MKKLILSALLMTTAAQLSPAAADNASRSGAPLIERQTLFGNPTRAGGQISPDGKWLSWLGPRDGVLNIFVAPVGSPDAGKPMTASKDRPIRQYYWSPDSSALLYIQDKGGDENFLLYRVDVKTGVETVGALGRCTRSPPPPAFRRSPSSAGGG